MVSLFPRNGMVVVSVPRSHALTCMPGRIAHVVFMILCLVNNIFASANMLLGAAAVIAAVYV